MRIFLTVAFLGCCLLADDIPQGLPARPSATDYATQTKWQSTTFAASLVPQKQVEHLFAFDISKAFLVFEVACYADNSADLKLSRDAFVVKVNPGNEVHNSEPGTVASTVQRQNQPPMPDGIGPHVSTAATIGYEHGTDPYSGRPVNGVYTGGEVTVNNDGRDNSPPRDPKPGGTSEDRRLLETQLRARSLPEGPVHHPVAGYIFFRKSDLKAQPDGTYALEYLAADAASGTTQAITLAVPKKTR
jgi:hypothetical protein